MANHHDDDDYIDEEAIMNFVSGVIVDPYDVEPPVDEEAGPPQDRATILPAADVLIQAEPSDHHLQQRPGKALAYEFQGQMQAGGQSSSSAAAYGFDDDHMHMQMQLQVQTTTMPISIEEYLQQVPGESPSALLDDHHHVYGFHDVLQQEIQGAPSSDHVQGLLAAEEELCGYDSTDYDKLLNECWMACGYPEEATVLPGSGDDDDDDELIFSSPSSTDGSPPLLDSFLRSGLSDVADVLMRNEVENNSSGSGEGNPRQAADDDDQFNFVPYVPGEMNCGNCHVLREISHRSDNRVLHLLLHSTVPGTLEHATIDRKHAAGHDGEPPRSELLYVNLRGRTQEWVLSFMANLVEKLGNDTSGTLEDYSYDPFQVAVASSSASPKPKQPITNPLHAQLLENGMLNMMLYPSDIHGEQPPDTEDVANTIDDTPFYVTILESSHVSQPQAEQYSQNAAVHPSHEPIMGSSHGPQEEQSNVNADVHPSMLTGRQVITGSRLTMQEMKQYINYQMAKAQEELKVPSAVIRKFCRQNANYTWMRLRIRKLNRKISKLGMSSQDNVKRSEIEEIRKKINAFAVEKANLKVDIMRGMKKGRENNGCTSSQPIDKNNNKAGPSGT